MGTKAPLQALLSQNHASEAWPFPSAFPISGPRPQVLPLDVPQEARISMLGLL
jgi:hypothetical protein